jgi:predicted cupin superfamily sugar epimerase
MGYSFIEFYEKMTNNRFFCIKIAPMCPDTKALIEHYRMRPLPVEGTYFSSTYRSSQEYSNGDPVGTAMIGLYADEPYSVSCFHRLPTDEIWHFYAGDPFKLVLLFPDGTSKEVIMGSDALAGQQVQFVVPAQVWQAGYMLSGGCYSLFGCTMAPGFTSKAFEAGVAEDLLKHYPQQKEHIEKLCVKSKTHMPEGFAT